MKNVLLVEDEAVVSISISEALKNAGYSVMISKTGEDAIRLLGHGYRVDLVLMDIELGRGMSGIDAAEEILKNYELPIVFITGHVDPETIEKTEKISSYGYVIKNTGDPVLLASIKMAFRLFEANKKISRQELELDATCSELDTAMSEMGYVSEQLDSVTVELLQSEKELMLTEQYLQLSEEQFRFAMEGANIGVWGIDLEKGSAFVSPRGCEIMGYSPGELNSTPYFWNEIVHKEDLRKTNECIQSHLEGIIPRIEIEHRLLTKSGDWKWVHTRGKVMSRDSLCRPTRLSGIFMDISENKAIKDRLEYREELFRSFMEHSPIYVFFKDENIRAIELSRNYEKMIGKPLEEILGKNMDELFPSDLAKSMVQDDIRILKEGKPIEVIEELEGRTYSTLKFPILKEGRPPLLAGFTVDITEKKMAEDMLKRTIEEKESLFLELQHRVKNSLTLISSLVGLESARSSDGVKKTMSSLQSRISSLSHLYEMLSNSKNVNSIRLDYYIENLSRSALNIYLSDDRKVELVLSLEEIEIDVKRAVSIGLIINELIVNAVKYAFLGMESGIISVSMKSSEGNILIGLEDDGIGLTESNKRKDGKKGIGLELVHMLTSQLQGQIEYIACKGLGYRITIPK